MTIDQVQEAGRVCRVPRRRYRQPVMASLRNVRQSAGDLG